jgi:hypothetical protein
MGRIYWRAEKGCFPIAEPADPSAAAGLALLFWKLKRRRIPCPPLI